MALIINTNISSLNAQRNLNNSQNDLNVSLQRLSSGLRINSAKDDAAGLFVAGQLTRDIRGNNQAVRNAADGISLGQTAEGALGQIANNLQRIREIAIQAANQTVGNADGLQLEVDQLTQEITRIIKTTEFNGTPLLQGEPAQSDPIPLADATVTVNGQTFTFANLDALNMALEASDPPVGVTAIADPADSDNFILVSQSTFTVGTDTFSPTPRQINFQVGSGGSEDSRIVVTLTDISAISAFGLNGDITALRTIDVTTGENARMAIDALSEDIDLVNASRATFGAVQNRFEAVIANLQNYSENLSAARSRIEDADFAAETARLTRAQILQQAGTTILAQANALPQSALALLQG